LLRLHRHCKSKLPENGIPRRELGFKEVFTVECSPRVIGHGAIASITCLSVAAVARAVSVRPERGVGIGARAWRGVTDPEFPAACMVGGDGYVGRYGSYGGYVF
jgi:hypothetical protein